MTTKLSLTLAAAACVAALSACPGVDGPGIIDNEDLKTCEASEQCPTGNVCSAGSCILGTCDPLLENACDVEGLDGPYCCKPWELCSTLSFQCENDPNVDGIGCDGDDPSCTPCEVQADCAGGQFCSAATCLDAAGRADCTSSFQCPAGERCDRTVFLCVPDRGACQFCGPDFPELCCEDGQTCSEQTGFCNDIPDAECVEDTDCAAGLFCNDVSICVQCVQDADCGPGLLCDEGDGECFADSSCTNDDECNGNQRCAPASQTCVLPECESDSACRQGGDDRLVCDLGSFLCELPPPVCPEDDDVDEPNDDPSTATPIANFSFSGYLCRDDDDLLSFPVQPNKRYTATVNFGGSGQPGIIVTMLATDLTLESTSQFSATQASVQVAGVTGPDESGTFYVKIQGNNDDNDRWTYTVTIAEDEPSQPADCSEAGQAQQEPNDSFETATELVLGEARSFSRCGTGDVDFFHVVVPPLNGVQVTVDRFFNAEGNLNVELFKAPNTNSGSRVDSATNVNDIELVEGPEVSGEFWVKVTLGSTAGAVPDQTYRVTATAVPRPAACFPDASEPDGSVETASVIAVEGDPPAFTRTDVVRCNPQDKDFYRFTMPPNLGGVVLLRFTHSEGDMRLDLFRADEPTTVIDSSNVSNANSDPDEQVSVPGSTTPIDYIAVAGLAGTAGGIVGQKYTIEMQTFDYGQCIATEPDGGDNVFADGRCIGNFEELRAQDQCVNDTTRIPEPMITPTLAFCATAAPGTPGCGIMCDNDDNDWYRVGILNNDQVLHAVLDYDVTLGELALARGTLNASTGAVTETAANDTDRDGHVELSFAAPRNSPKEYGIRVKPIGTTGHLVQPYALKIEVGAECLEDPNDLASASNEKPATATIIRTNAQNVAGVNYTFTSTGLTRCTNDVDVYELITLTGETVTVELDQQDTSPNGLIVELGTRPADLNNPAVFVQSAVAGAAPMTFDNPETQTLYLTVKVPQGVVVTGPYTLRVTAD